MSDIVEKFMAKNLAVAAMLTALSASATAK